jgi:hypothetical protein
VHVIRVIADGYEPRSLEVTIRERETGHQRVELTAPAPHPVDLAVHPATSAAPAHERPRLDKAEEPAPSFWSRPLTWVVIGAVVAAGTTAALVIATQDHEQPPYGGSVGATF